MDDLIARTDLALILAVDGSFTLARGEEMLDGMLLGDQSYPLPVVCVRFPSRFEMGLFLSDVAPGSMWAINPKIIERMFRDGHITEIAYQPGDMLQP